MSNLTPESSGFDLPNFTQVPNGLLDNHLVHMDKAELKVVLAVLRLTVGYEDSQGKGGRREKCRISTRNLAKKTGLSRTSVKRGAGKAEQRGLLKRNQDGGVTEWEIIWNDPPDVGVDGGSEIDPPEQMVDQALTQGGPGVDPGLDQILTQDGASVDPPSIKETSKESGKQNVKERSDAIADQSHKTAAYQHRAMLMSQKGGLPWEVPDHLKSILIEFGKVWTEVYGRKIMLGDRSKWIKGAEFLHTEFGESASEFVLEAGKIHYEKKDEKKKRLSLNGPRGLHYAVRELAYVEVHKKPQSKAFERGGARPG